MPIPSQAYVASNLVSTISTLVMYLVLKSPAWAIQQTGFIIFHILLDFSLSSSDKSYICGILNLLDRE